MTGSVLRLPRMFSRKDAPNIAARDPRIAAVIIIQAALSEFAEEEQAFIMQTVERNLELHRRHGRDYVLEE